MDAEPGHLLLEFQTKWAHVSYDSNEHENWGRLPITRMIDGVNPWVNTRRAFAEAGRDHGHQRGQRTPSHWLK